MSAKIYEAVDATSDEQYFTIGIWFCLEDAIEAFKKLKDNFPGEDLGSTSKVVEIRERETGKIGWSENGKLVARFTWVEEYNRLESDYEWKLSKFEKLN